MFEITNVEETIRNEIMNGATQKDIAKTCALARRSTYPTDWDAVVEMIINRWSVSGMKRINDMAASGSCWSDEVTA